MAPRPLHGCRAFGTDEVADRQCNTYPRSLFTYGQHQELIGTMKACAALQGLAISYLSIDFVRRHGVNAVNPFISLQREDGGLPLIAKSATGHHLMAGLSNRPLREPDRTTMPGAYAWYRFLKTRNGEESF